jgi:hypothetical protein
MKEDKLLLSQSPTEKDEDVKSASTKQSLREERILERCHFIMDVLWRSVMVRNNIWVVFT